eukprot:408107-Prymnesium_polylepis.1
MNTSLILAAEGEPELVEILCAAGANVNAQNKNGVTPLMAAVRYEDEQVIELLLGAGADMQVKDKRGRTAVDLARTNNDLLTALGLGTNEVKPEVKQEMHKNKRRASVSGGVSQN